MYYSTQQHHTIKVETVKLIVKVLLRDLSLITVVGGEEVAIIYTINDQGICNNNNNYYYNDNNNNNNNYNNNNNNKFFFFF